MIDHHVYMLITGKILEENGTFTSMMLFNAISGIRRHILLTITKAAHLVDSVKKLMDGKNWNFILISTNQVLVNMEQTVINFIALFTILLKRKDKQTTKDFKSFQKLEQFASRLLHM